MARQQGETVAKIPAKSIVLVGMMGVGKTSVGKRLAHSLGIPFRDADAEIEKAANLSISDIFAMYGESEFRALERRVMKRLMEGTPHVIATGGGAFVNDETRAAIREHGVSIWLKAALPTLLERTSRRPGKRPLLTKGNAGEVLERLMRQREHIYAEADIHIVSDRQPIKHVVDQLIHQLQEKGIVQHDT